MKKIISVLVFMFMGLGLFALPPTGIYESDGTVFMNGKTLGIDQDLQITVYIIETEDMVKFIITDSEGNFWVRARDMNDQGRDQWGMMFGELYYSFYESTNTEDLYAWHKTLTDGSQVIFNMRLIQSF